MKDTIAVGCGIQVIKPFFSGGNISSVTRNSQSVRTQISTREDGTIEERRTVRTVGSDGVPMEETTTIIHDNSSDTHRPIIGGPSGIPENDPFTFSLIFGDRPPFEERSNPFPSDHGQGSVSGNQVRNQFLTKRPPLPVSYPSSTATFQPSFKTPDYSKNFSDNLSKIIRP